MALTKKQLAARKDITASFVPILMSGNQEKILNGWRGIVGDPDYVEEDLSTVWPVQFGSFVEPFALKWYSKKNGIKLSRQGEVVTHPRLPYISCTLDAYDASGLTVIDVKTIGAYRKIDEVISYYTPQLIVQRDCVLGSMRTALLIVHGGAEPELHNVEIDPDYEKQVWIRIDQFWQCIKNLTPPFDMPKASAPVVPVRTYDMSTDNVWCSHAGVWLSNKQPAKDFADAAKIIKDKVPADGIIAHGGGITVNRNKAGSLSIKEGN